MIHSWVNKSEMAHDVGSDPPSINGRVEVGSRLIIKNLLKFQVSIQRTSFPKTVALTTAPSPLVGIVSFILVLSSWSFSLLFLRLVKFSPLPAHLVVGPRPLAHSTILVLKSVYICTL